MCDSRAKRLSKGKGNRSQQSVRDSPKLVVLCGPSHAGKSIFARQHLKGCRIVSTDRLRERLGVTFARYEPEPEVWKAFEAEKCRALREGVSVVLDACHMSERARWHALQGLNARHRKVCIVFDPPLETVSQRCLKDGRISLKEVERMWRAFQRSKPTTEQLRREGFNEVRFVRNRREERLTAARLAGRAGSGSAARVAGNDRPAPSVVRPVWVDTAANDGLWDCRVRYVAPEEKEPEVGESSFSFDTGGGTQHITQSLQTIQKYAPPGKTAPDFKGAVGVTHDNVEGVDITVPVYNFSETHYIDDGDVNKGAYFALTGKVNNAAWKGFAAGEVLFLGASGSKRGSDDWEITFRFAASPNKTGLTVGDIVNIDKKGWEYMWVRYADAEDADAKAIVKKPVAVYVEKVYEDGDFSTLGIGT